MDCCADVLNNALPNQRNGTVLDRVTGLVTKTPPPGHLMQIKSQIPLRKSPPLGPVHSQINPVWCLWDELRRKKRLSMQHTQHGTARRYTPMTEIKARFAQRIKRRSMKQVVELRVNRMAAVTWRVRGQYSKKHSIPLTRFVRIISGLPPTNATSRWRSSSAVLACSVPLSAGLLTSLTEIFYGLIPRHWPLQSPR